MAGAAGWLSDAPQLSQKLSPGRFWWPQAGQVTLWPLVGALLAEGACTVGASFSDTAAGATLLSDAPHSSQNASPGRTVAPQEGQVAVAAGAATLAGALGLPAATSSREPHCSQKRLPASLSAPQVGHFMVAPSYQNLLSFAF
jgi:hypothetical protein